MDHQAQDVVRRFGPFEVRGRAGEVWRNGTRIRLQEQPFRLLLYLLERGGDVVSREELREHLWPADKFVDFEHGLNTAIKKLREALSDSATEPSYIETVPRKGYRLIVPVSVVGHQRPAAAQRASFFVTIAASLAVVAIGGALVFLKRADTAKITSVAVLPLENLSGDPQQEYLADGMTEALIADLGKVGGLSVISRTSVMHYKHTRKPLREIARELRVQAVVEGAVLRSGSRLRITTRLVNAANDRDVWTETYVRDAHDVMGLQDDVARAIAGRIKVTLVPPQERGTLNPEAEEAYFQGLHEADKYSEEGLRKAIGYFEDAVRKDPQYAEAWAGLAYAYNLSATFRFVPVEEGYPKAAIAAQRAVRLNDNLSQAHFAMSEVDLNRWWWDASEKELRRAIALNPNDAAAHQMLGYLLSGVRCRFPEGVAEMKRALDLDPLTPNKKNSLAAALYYAGRYDEAVPLLRELPDDDANSERRHRRLSLIYERKGMLKEAVAELAAIAKLWGNDELVVAVERSFQSSGYGAGKKTFLMAAVAEALKRAKEPDPAGAAAGIAGDYAMLGDKDQAFSWLEKAIEGRETGVIFLRADPRWDSLRSDPRFEAILRRVGLGDGNQQSS